jgi:hypothetical protein
LLLTYNILPLLKYLSQAHTHICPHGHEVRVRDDNLHLLSP